jgi:hypothetical protein
MVCCGGESGKVTTGIISLGEESLCTREPTGDPFVLITVEPVLLDAANELHVYNKKHKQI